MLSRGYQHELVEANSGKFVVFPIVDKEYASIAWPTVDGAVWIPDESDVVFQLYKPLQDMILPLIKPGVKVLLFPRFIG